MSKIKPGEFVRLADHVSHFSRNVFPWRTKPRRNEHFYYGGDIEIDRPVKAERSWVYEVRAIEGDRALLITKVLKGASEFDAAVFAGWFDVGDLAPVLLT